MTLGEASGARSRSGGQDVVCGLLTLTAGSIDALSFLGLDVFTSAMSGNAILLGLALGQGRLIEASRSGAAFLGYMLGVAAARVAGLPTGPSAIGWSPVVRVLSLEALLLAAFAGLWLACHVTLMPAASVYALILLAAIPMGLQGAVGRHLNLPGITTVVFTSTLTAIVGTLADAALARPPRRVSWQTGRQIVIFVLYVASAALTGLLTRWVLPALAVMPLAFQLLGCICARAQRGAPCSD